MYTGMPALSIKVMLEDNLLLVLKVIFSGPWINQQLKQEAFTKLISIALEKPKKNLFLVDSSLRGKG